MKQQILQQHQQLLQDKIDVFRDMISGLTEDAQNDAKGSAGDKHETALSMMHIEQEKLNHKLKEILNQKAILDKIDASTNEKTLLAEKWLREQPEVKQAYASVGGFSSGNRGPCNGSGRAQASV